MKVTYVYAPCSLCDGEVAPKHIRQLTILQVLGEEVIETYPEYAGTGMADFILRRVEIT